MDPTTSYPESTLIEPVTLPISVEQYETLVDAGTFEGQRGQIELIHGRIVRMNPQGPQHADPIDILTEWSVQRAAHRFRIRIEKPIRIPDHDSSPEPDIAWVTRRRYADQHPGPDDIHLLIEVSHTSGQFDRGEKAELYAQARIPEYWQVDVPSRTVTLYRDPDGAAFRSIETAASAATLQPLCLPQAALVIAELFVEP